MTQIKAAFFDIDGTLLPFHAKALPESTVQALAALRKNGVKNQHLTRERHQRRHGKHRQTRQEKSRSQVGVQ